MNKILVKTFDGFKREVIVPYSDLEKIKDWLKKFHPLSGMIAGIVEISF